MESFFYALIAALSAALPFILDQSFDYLQDPSRDPKGIISCLKLLTIVIISNTAIFFIMIPINGLVYVPLVFYIREFFLIYVIVNILRDTELITLDLKSSHTVTLFYSFYAVLGIIQTLVDSDNLVGVVLFTISLALKLLGTIRLLYLFYTWLTNFEIESLHKSELSDPDYKRLIYVSTVSCFLLISWLIYFMLGFIMDSTRPMPLYYMISYTYVEATFVIALTILNGRLARHEAVQTLVRQLINLGGRLVTILSFKPNVLFAGRSSNKTCIHPLRVPRDSHAS